MRRFTAFGIIVLVASLTTAIVAEAQSTGSSLRGYVKDDQGGVLPGVTVTATSPDMIQPASAVTDATGYYRLINLPPGEYAISAELPGFSTFKREGILLRAAVNFQVDITMSLGTLAETITVTGESPMLEVSKPGNVLNIDGEFQKQMPLAARKNWTDFLEQTPGVHSRPFDDGSGRSVYFGHATEHFAHVVQLEGMQAGNYNDFQLTYVQMGSDMIQDTQVKTGGSDAATPMGTGLAINVITKSGGNSFRGTAGYAYQPLRWTSDNTHHRTVFDLGGSPLAQYTTCPTQQCVTTGGTPVRRCRPTSASSTDRSAGRSSGIACGSSRPSASRRSRRRSAATRRTLTTSSDTSLEPRSSRSRSRGISPTSRSPRGWAPGTSCRGSSSATARTDRATGSTSSTRSTSTRTAATSTAPRSRPPGAIG
jgi:hypothetical protein